MTTQDPRELEADHIQRLEKVHQHLADLRALWEKREGSHLGATEVLEQLDTEVELNEQLLLLANKRLEWLSM